MIYEQKQCKYCNQIFKNIEGRVFSNHIRWCDKNPKPKVTQKGLENWKKAVDNKHGKIIKSKTLAEKSAWDFIKNQTGDNKLELVVMRH